MLGMAIAQDRVALGRCVVPVARPGDLQHFPEELAVLVDQTPQDFMRGSRSARASLRKKRPSQFGDFLALRSSLTSRSSDLICSRSEVITSGESGHQSHLA
jgi:hypothetical protein